MSNLNPPEYLFILLVVVTLIGIIVLVPISFLHGQAEAEQAKQKKETITKRSNLMIAIMRYIGVMVTLFVSALLLVVAWNIAATLLGILIPTIGLAAVAFLAIKWLLK